MVGFIRNHRMSVGCMVMLLIVFCCFCSLFSPVSGIASAAERSGMTLRAGFYPDEGGCFGILKPQGQLIVLFSNLSSGPGIRSFPFYAALLQKSCGVLLLFLFLFLKSVLFFSHSNFHLTTRFFAKLCPVRAGPFLY